MTSKVPLSLMLKTYVGDLEYVKRLLFSIENFNIDRIPIHVVAPKEDRQAFERILPSEITFIEEEMLSKHMVREPINGIRVGYVNQEIIKLSFWELDVAENYFCMDSDLTFLRAFRFNDFMKSETVPYSFVTEDRELQLDREYYETFGEFRNQKLQDIRDAIDYQHLPILTCHGHNVFSGKVLASMNNDFLEPMGYTYADLIRICPYEFSWYNFWHQKSLAIPFHPRESFVKIIHTPKQMADLIAQQVTEDDLTRAYLGVVFNSNFSRDLGPTDIGGNRSRSLSFSLTRAEIYKIVFEKFRQDLRKVKRKLLFQKRK